MLIQMALLKRVEVMSGGADADAREKSKPNAVPSSAQRGTRRQDCRLARR
jgi:hypothetical protein